AIVAGIKIGAPSGDINQIALQSVLGVTLRNSTMDGGDTTLFNNGILVNGSPGAAIINNKFTRLSKAILLEQGSSGVSIVGNVFQGNFDGIDVLGGSARIEMNTIRLNFGNGVSLLNGLLDLGGGSLGSAGQNTISCNTFQDVVTAQPLVAENNAW